MPAVSRPGTGIAIVLNMVTSLGSNNILTKQETKMIERLIECQLADYNRRDLDAFLNHYHQDVEMFRTTADNRTVQGIDQLKEVYSSLFASSPRLSAVVSRRSINNWEVTDYEHVAGLRDSDKVLNFKVTYYVEPTSLKIRKIFLIPQ